MVKEKNSHKAIFEPPHHNLAPTQGDQERNNEPRPNKQLLSQNYRV